MPRNKNYAIKHYGTVYVCVNIFKKIIIFYVFRTEIDNDMIIFDKIMFLLFFKFGLMYNSISERLFATRDRRTDG